MIKILFFIVKRKYMLLIKRVRELIYVKLNWFIEF